MKQRRITPNGRAKNTVDAGVNVILTSDHPKHSRGSIISVFRPRRFDEFVFADGKFSRTGGVLSPHTGIVYALNVPDEQFRRLHRITQPEYHPNDPDYPDEDENLTGGRKRARKWRLIIPELSNPNRDELLSTKQLTLTWIQFKNRVKNMRTGNYLSDNDLTDTDPDPA